MGRKISTLVNNVKKAGTHHIVWNGKDTFGNEMPSGLYLYSLESNGGVYTKKMQLLK
jgi:flagellar hook assembly protein FlgD